MAEINFQKMNKKQILNEVRDLEIDDFQYLSEQIGMNFDPSISTWDTDAISRERKKITLAFMKKPKKEQVRILKEIYN